MLVGPLFGEVEVEVEVLTTSPKAFTQISSRRTDEWPITGLVLARDPLSFILVEIDSRRLSRVLRNGPRARALSLAL